MGSNSTCTVFVTRVFCKSFREKQFSRKIQVLVTLFFVLVFRWIQCNFSKSKTFGVCIQLIKFSLPFCQNKKKKNDLIYKDLKSQSFLFINQHKKNFISITKHGREVGVPVNCICLELNHRKYVFYSLLKPISKHCHKFYSRNSTISLDFITN